MLFQDMLRLFSIIILKKPWKVLKLMNIEEIDFQTAEAYYSFAENNFKFVKRNYPQKWHTFFWGTYLIPMAKRDMNNLINSRQILYELDLSIPAKQDKPFEERIRSLILDINIFLSQFKNTKDIWNSFLAH